MEPYLTNTYLFCLHKDETNLSKLRPIGVPTALRRIITSHVAKTFCHRFALNLLPFNFAIGIYSGMDFVVKASQLSVDKYITSKQKQGDAPSRCFVSLDLKNMFSELSREKIFELVQANYSELFPLVSMLYRKPGSVFCKMNDSQWHTEFMKEGVNQDCPLSSTIAAFLLNKILLPLTAKLKARAKARLQRGNPGDDRLGGVTDPMAYIDDCGANVYVEDVWFFLEEFNRL